MALSLSPERTWSALGWGNVLLITGVLTVALIHDAARPGKEGKRETILTRARSFDWSSYARDLPYQKWNLLYFLIAAIVWSCATPRLERAAELRADWIAFVVVRNLVILWGWYEPLHRYLYVGPRRHQFVKEGKKFNPEFPPESQHLRDRLFSTLGGLQMSAYEVLWLHLLANGTLPAVASHSAAPLWCVGWYILSPFWVKVHFYFVHRFREYSNGCSRHLSTRSLTQALLSTVHIKFMYRWVHYLHHRVP